MTEIRHYLSPRAPSGIRDEAERQTGIAKPLDRRKCTFNRSAAHINDASKIQKNAGDLRRAVVAFLREFKNLRPDYLKALTDRGYIIVEQTAGVFSAET